MRTSRNGHHLTSCFITSRVNSVFPRCSNFFRFLLTRVLNFPETSSEESSETLIETLLLLYIESEVYYVGDDAGEEEDEEEIMILPSSIKTSRMELIRRRIQKRA